MSRLLLHMDDLVIGYRDRRGRDVEVLRGVSLEVKPGQTLGLVGESGCGKTTICAAMLGQLPVGNRRIRGRVWFNGIDVLGLSLESLRKIHGRRIGLVSQNAGQSLNPAMRVGRHLAEVLALRHNLRRPEARARAVEWLSRMLLPEPEALARRYPHELSGGQQRRVTLALALAPQPEVLILDEPTSGLDVTTKARLLDLLRRVQREEGLAMLYVSHDLGEIAGVSDSIAVMFAGEVVESAPAAELFSRPAHPYTQTLLGSIPSLSTPSKRHTRLGGTPASPDRRAEGCSFAPRCQLADDVCATVPPKLESCARESHQVRCHHWRDTSAAQPVARAQGDSRPVAEQESDAPLIELEGVEVTYSRPSLLDRLRRRQESPPAVGGVTLTVKRGETLALVGESGSGKTTLVQALAGLSPMRQGRLRFSDTELARDVGKRPLELCRRIQLIFQDPDVSLNPRRTVAEIIDRPLRLYFGLGHRERRERVELLLGSVRLGPQFLSRYPGQLSGGEKQRVAIARAFAAEPQVVLCDEVTSAMDASIRASILDLLAELQAARGVTYVFVTHDLALALTFADRVAVLYQGRLCELMPTRQFHASPHHPYTDELMRAAAEINQIPSLIGKGLKTSLACEGPEQFVPARGCPYQRRCARRLGPICDHETPCWQSTSEGHGISCHIPLSDQ